MVKEYLPYFLIMSPIIDKTPEKIFYVVWIIESQCSRNTVKPHVFISNFSMKIPENCSDRPFMSICRRIMRWSVTVPGIWLDILPLASRMPIINIVLVNYTRYKTSPTFNQSIGARYIITIPMI